MLKKIFFLLSLLLISASLTACGTTGSRQHSNEATEPTLEELQSHFGSISQE